MAMIVEGLTQGRKLKSVKPKSGDYSKSLMFYEKSLEIDDSLP